MYNTILNFFSLLLEVPYLTVKVFWDLILDYTGFNAVSTVLDLSPVIQFSIFDLSLIVILVIFTVWILKLFVRIAKTVYRFFRW